jgi:hypothetical protein
MTNDHHVCAHLAGTAGQRDSFDGIGGGRVCRLRAIPSLTIAHQQDSLGGQIKPHDDAVLVEVCVMSAIRVEDRHRGLLPNRNGRVVNATGQRHGERRVGSGLP